jgi:hypothetical protein
MFATCLIQTASHPGSLRAAAKGWAKDVSSRVLVESATLHQHLGIMMPRMVMRWEDLYIHMGRGFILLLKQLFIRLLPLGHLGHDGRFRMIFRHLTAHDHLAAGGLWHPIRGGIPSLHDRLIFSFHNSHDLLQQDIVVMVYLHLPLSLNLIVISLDLVGMKPGGPFDMVPRLCNFEVSLHIR